MATYLRRQTFIALTLCSSIAGGCQQKNQENGVPDITSESEEGFHDLVFTIEGRQETSGGGQLIKAAGAYGNVPVGFTVFLGPTWAEGRLAPDIPQVTFRGTVRLGSTGEGSDRLLTAIDELYATGQRPRGMRAATDFTGISLEGDPRHLETGLVKIKLFYEAEDEARYAELFLNIDLTARKLHLDGKDPDYRSAVVRALAGP